MKKLFPSNTRTPFSWEFLVALPVFASGVLSPACAAESDVLRPHLSYSLSYNDNVLGLPDERFAQAVTGGDQLSDLSRALSGGIAFEKKIGQQFLSADASVSRVDYSHFWQLDHKDKKALAGWNWHLGSRLQGNLQTSYTQDLTSFVDFHQLALNLRTQIRHYLDGSWELHPDWRVNAGISRYDLSYSLPSQQVGDRTQNEAQGGVDYIARSGSSVGLQLKRMRGNFPNPQQVGSAVIQNDFNQKELKAKVDWKLSGKSRIQFLGGRVERKHESLPSRDYSGTNSRLTADWLASGKLKFGLAAWKEIGAVDDLTTVYSLNRGVSATANWAYTEKMLLDVSMRREKRDFTQSAVLLNTLVPGYTDVLRNTSATLTYLPWQKLQCQFSVYRSAKDIDLFQSGYISNGLTLSAYYKY